MLKSKSAKMLNDRSAFHFQNFTVFFRMCTKYTKNCDVCHWKYETGVAINIYNICKGRLGGRRVVEAKQDIKHLTKIDHFTRWLFILYNYCINIYTLS